MAENRETLPRWERLESTPALNEDDVAWLLGLSPQLQLNKNWFNRINKHLVLACQSLRHQEPPHSDNITKFRRNIFKQLGLLDEAHALHQLWLDELLDDYCMSPEYFIENARRLSKTETNLAKAFKESPYLWKRHANLVQTHNMWKDDAWVESFELGGATPENGSAKRLAHILHAQHLLGAVTAEMPHVAYDAPHKQIIMARIALELYKNEDFSNLQTLTEFLQWSPEALLITALANTEPTLADVSLKDELEERGMHSYTHTKRSVLGRHRHRLLKKACKVTTNETALASKALKTYFRYFPNQREHHKPMSSHEQVPIASYLDETDYKWLRQRVGETVVLDENWLTRMNYLLVNGSSQKQPRIERFKYREEFFETLNLGRGKAKCAVKQLPLPSRLVEIAHVFKKWQVENINDILNYSVRCLYLKAETVDTQMQIWHENGYDFTHPNVQTLLPRLLHKLGLKGLRTTVQPYKSREFQAAASVESQKKDKSRPARLIHNNEPIEVEEVHEFTDDHLEAARFIADNLHGEILPEVLIERLGLYRLSKLQTVQLIDLIVEYARDELRLRDVVKLIESL